jgi:hypothetical protein
MRSRPTPRLCAQCGKELPADDTAVTLEDVRSGEQRHLHRACFERAYEPRRSEPDTQQ